jgi:hypothetical protein
MKYIKEWKVFESTKYEETKEIIETLHDMSLEFIDNNCSVRIEPSNDIRIKVMALQGPGVFSGIEMPFYIEIDVLHKIIAPDKDRSGFGPLPDWFIERCRTIQSYLSSSGFRTEVLIRYGTDWEGLGNDQSGLDRLDRLSEVTSLIYKVRLEFSKV